MINHIKGLLIIVGLGISSFTAIDSYSQTLTKHNWYFGNTQRSIRFNRVTNAASLITNKAVPFGTGGSAVATDRGTGNLLFYTDGNRIYGANHLPMPNGNLLTGTPGANQPVATCPVPGEPGKYFVFTNSANFNAGGAVSYSIVDLTLFGSATFPSPPTGNVTAAKNVAIPTLVNLSEGMITVPHDNGRDFWLITQTVNSRLFNATLINNASFTANTFNTVSSTGTNFPTTIAHLAYHEGTNKIAAAPQEASTNASVMTFNDATGVITFTVGDDIPNSAVLSTTTQAIYDIEWSPSGQYLYLSRHGEAGVNADVFQYDYLNSSITLRSVLPAPVFRSYGLQRGPDNQIYHLYQSSAAGPFLLGRIQNPDSVAARARYNAAPAGFAALDFDGKQFPGFAPRDTVELKLDFTFAGECQNSPVTFFPFVRPGADSLQWSFGDGTNGRGWSPIHTYENAGGFNVVLRAFYQGQIDSVSKPVPVKTFQLQLQLTQDTTACKEEFPPPRGSSSPQQFSVKVGIQGGTAASIVWSNGDLGETLTPDSAGYYYVVVTDAGGCSAYAGVNVKEYGLQTQIFNKWYFGNRAGIDFTTNQPLNESAMDAPEGCAIACDRNGQQIFYTDGSTVWDKTHAIIDTNIGGNPLSSQSSIIVPLPDDETIFYIFTTQDLDNGSDSLQLNYSVFDLKKNAGKGAIIKKNVLLFMKSTERVTSNGQWLLVHDLGNSTFRSYPITPDGIGNQVYSDIGTDHSASIPSNGKGYMKLGPRNLVAVPISTPGTSNRIELFQLTDSTGVLSNYKNIDLNEPNGSIYGLEFSAAGNKLFASVKYLSGSSAIYEYSIDSLFRPKFRQRIPVAAALGAIQIGPDGGIYVATDNAGNNTSLGTITANEDTLATSSFTLNGFQLAAGTNSRLGLPNFINITTSDLGGPGITVTGLCLGDSTRFAGSPRDQIDEYRWNVFRNGAFLANSQEAEFALLLPGPGDYSVTLQLHNRCAPDTTMTRAFRVTPPPADPSRGVPLCNTPTAQLDANPNNVPGLTYEWLTGETTEILTVNEQGVYRVEISDALGCTRQGQFLVADSRPIFALGPDLTVCEDNNTPALNVNNPGMTYAWTINGVASSTTSTQAVDTSTPGNFTYAVTVTDPVTLCFRTEDKAYTVNVSPAFTMSGTPPAVCGTATGTVSINLTASVPAGGPLYSYFISGPGSTSVSNIDQTAPNTFTAPNVAAGTYTGIVQDQISGCTMQAAFGLSDANFSITSSIVPPICDPVVVQVAAPGATPLVSFTVTNSATGAVLTGSGQPTTFNLPALTRGSYVVSVTDANNCTNSFNQLINPPASPTVTLTPDLCNNTLTASIPGAATYAWTATPSSGITGPTSLATINLTPNAGTVTYSVIATPTAGCPGTDDITLNVGNIPTPAITQTSACEETGTLNVTPPGTFNYRWYVNGALDTSIGGTTEFIDLADDGKTYRVDIYEPISGCVKPSADFVAHMFGRVDASLTSTPPCEDGQPITLTATTAAISPTFAWARNGSALTGVTTPTTQQTEEGTYRVTITRGTCNATADLTINRNPLPIGQLRAIALICDDPENLDPETATVDLDPGNFVEYAWSKNSITLNYTERVFTADSKGIYEVKITDASRCTAIDKTEVINECLPKINAPNAFKPGSTVFNPDRKDLTNGDFWVFTRFIEDDQFKVFIFNRWGEMVYSSSDRFFKWNGGYNNDLNRPLPPGTYSYVVQYVSAFRPNDGVKEKRGGVALIR